MIAGAARWTARSAWSRRPDGPVPQRVSTSCSARQVGSGRIVVALNRPTVDDSERSIIVELEVSELLSKYEFPGRRHSVIQVSALMRSRATPEWTPKILELMKRRPHSRSDARRRQAVPSRSRDVFTAPATNVVTAASSRANLGRRRFEMMDPSEVARRRHGSSNVPEDLDYARRPATTRVCSCAVRSAKGGARPGSRKPARSAARTHFSRV